MAPSSNDRAADFDAFSIDWAKHLGDDEDDAYHDRLTAFIRADPLDALERGEGLRLSNDASERELAVLVVGISAEVDRDLIGRALPTLRAVLDAELARGPIATAVAKLGNLGDLASRGAIVGLAAHSDIEIRYAVAHSLPLLEPDEAALQSLRQLSRDPDDDIRNWATFGLGTQSDDRSKETAEALVDRLDDPDAETRLEAIIGLARRRDERVRSLVVRALDEWDSPALAEAATRMGIPISESAGRSEFGR
jgi:HEAT repeat protein